MATQTTVRHHRVDASLRDIWAEVEFLPELALLWPDEAEPAQVAYLLEWDELMARLRGLERAYRAGRMTPEQAARYLALLRRLKETLPIVERLGFTRPRVSLEP